MLTSFLKRIIAKHNTMEYRHVVCGGTFDRLHKGHKAFLEAVFSYGEKVDIGLTTDAYVQQFKKGQIQPYAIRKQQLEEFLQEKDWLTRSSILPIDDVYGKTLDGDAPYGALVVSEESAKSGEDIVQQRKKRGLSPFVLIVVPLLYATNGEKISSTHIREGFMGRNGENFALLTQKTLLLPPSLRDSLSHPFGELFSGDIPQKYLQDPEKIVTIGDLVTKRFNQMHVGQRVSLIDFSIERKKQFSSIKELGFSGEEQVLALTNPAGQVSSSVWKTLREVFAQKEGRSVVVVEGEEDLLVIPCVLLIPLGYKIFYGQPRSGVIYLEVTEQIKKRLYQILTAFQPQ